MQASHCLLAITITTSSTTAIFRRWFYQAMLWDSRCLWWRSWSGEVMDERVWWPQGLWLRPWLIIGAAVLAQFTAANLGAPGSVRFGLLDCKHWLQGALLSYLILRRRHPKQDNAGLLRHFLGGSEWFSLTWVAMPFIAQRFCLGKCIGQRVTVTKFYFEKCPEKGGDTGKNRVQKAADLSMCPWYFLRRCFFDHSALLLLQWRES